MSDKRRRIGTGDAPNDKDEYQDKLAAAQDAVVDSTSGFQERIVAGRTNLINISGTYPLSNTRDTYQNADDTFGESRLFLADGSDDGSFLRTKQRARYIPGYESQVGMGVRIPQLPTDGTTYRWGYFDNPTEDLTEISTGFYFGADADGLFVAEDSDADELEQRIVRQEDWNRDTLSGAGGEDNPSGLELTPETGYVYQIEFIYYGYGETDFSVWVFDDEKQKYTKVSIHTLQFPGRSSLENINLPLRVEIAPNGETSENHEMFVGGRQFSIIGEYTPVTRLASHRRDTRTGVDATSWHSVISFRPKDGRENITIRLNDVQTIPGGDGYIQVRKSTNPPSDAVWSTPSDTTANETAIEVSENDAVPVSGEKILEETVVSGQGNQSSLIDVDDVDVPIGDNEVVTLYFRNLSGTDEWRGNVLQVTEEW